MLRCKLFIRLSAGASKMGGTRKGEGAGPVLKKVVESLHHLNLLRFQLQFGHKLESQLDFDPLLVIQVGRDLWQFRQSLGNHDSKYLPPEVRSLAFQWSGLLLNDNPAVQRLLSQGYERQVQQPTCFLIYPRHTWDAGNLPPCPCRCLPLQVQIVTEASLRLKHRVTFADNKEE